MGGGSEICIRVITQNNRGYSGARNAALSNIEAKYIMFLDSDDILPKDSISIMLDKAFITDADILQGSWYSFDDKKVSEKILEEKVFKDGTSGYVSGYPWGKLYKSSVLKNFQFPEGYWFEDTPVTFILAAMPIKIVTIKDIIYGYRLNPNGITAKAIFYKKAIDTFWVTDLCLNEFPRFKVAYDQRAYEYLLRQSLMNAARVKNQERKIRESIFVLTSELMRVHFSGFSTENLKMKKIEKALRDKRFIQFELSKLYL
jgi:glycosyltransferase involved in cell wall biosynthesis